MNHCSACNTLTARTYASVRGEVCRKCYRESIRRALVLDGGFPATDMVIVKYLLCLNNEKLFRSKANVNKPLQASRAAVRIDRPLIDVVREIRGQQPMLMRATA